MVPFDECCISIAETAVARLTALWCRSPHACLALCQRMVQAEEPEWDRHQRRESDGWRHWQDAHGYLARRKIPGGREARCDFEPRLPRSEWHKRRNRVDEVSPPGSRLIWCRQKPVRRGPPAGIPAVHRRVSSG